MDSAIPLAIPPDGENLVVRPARTPVVQDLPEDLPVRPARLSAIDEEINAAGPIRVRPAVSLDSLGRRLPSRTELPPIEQQQAAFESPRPFAQRLVQAIREAASPILGRTPAQVVNTETQQRQLLPDFRDQSDKQLEEKTFTPGGGVRPETGRSPVVTSIGRGIDQTQDIAYALAQWLETLTGADKTIAGMVTDRLRRENQEQLQQNQPTVGAARDIRSLNDALTYVIERAGENLPNTAVSMGAGGLAGAAARRALAGAAEGEIAKGVARAELAGMTGSNIAQETGSIFGQAVDEGNRDRTTAAIALGLGVPAGLLETVSDKLLLKRLKGGKDEPGLVGRQLEKFFRSPNNRSFIRQGVATVGDAALEQLLTESPTEYFQTLLEQAGTAASEFKDKDEFWRQFYNRVFSEEGEQERREAARAAAAAGLVTGGAAGAVGRARAAIYRELAVRQIRRILNEEPQITAQPGQEQVGGPAPAQPTPVLPAQAVLAETAGSPVQQSTVRPQLAVADRPPPVVVDRPPPVVSDRPPAAVLENLPIVRPDLESQPRSTTGYPETPPESSVPQDRPAPRQPADWLLPVYPTPPPEAAAPRPPADWLPAVYRTLPDLPTAEVQQQFEQDEAQTTVRPTVDRRQALQQLATAIPGSIEYQQALDVVRRTAPPTERAAAPVAPTAPAPPPTPPARPVSQAASQTPSQVNQPIRENLERRAAENEGRAREREARPDVPSKVLEQASAYLEQNPDQAQAVADFLQSSDYRDTVAGQGDVWVDHWIQDRIAQWVLNKKQGAFTKKEDGRLVLRIATSTERGGFPLVKIARQAKASYQRTPEARVARGEVNLTADQPEGARSPMETLAAQEQSAPMLSDELGIKDELTKGYAEDSVEAYGIKAIVLNRLGRTSTGGGVNLAALPEDVRNWVATNERRVLGRLKEIIDQRATEEGGGHTMIEVAQSLMAAYANALTGGGRGMTIDQVRQAVAAFLRVRPNQLPDNLLIVSDRQLRTTAGEPIKGLFIGSPAGNRIVLNAAQMNNAFDVQLAILHEGGHQVWDLPELQKLVQQLEAEVSGELPGYSPDEVREELAVRALTDQWASDQQRTLWQKIVDQLWAAVKKVLGLEPTVEEVRRQLAARIYRSIGQQEQTARNVVRYYKGFQVFHSQEDLTTALGEQTLTPQGRAELEQVAGATKRVIPQVTEGMLDNFRNSLDRVEQRVARALKWLSDIRQMTPPEQDLRAINTTVREVAARAILETDQRVRQARQRLQEQLPEAERERDEAVAEFQKAGPVAVQAQAAANLADQLVDKFEEQLDAQEQLAPSFNAQQKAALEAMKRHLGVIKTVGPAVTAALQSVAKVRPLGTDPLTFVQNEQAAGWPSFGGTSPMTQVVYDFLAGPSPALANTTAQMDRIRKVIDSRQAAQQVIDQVAQFFRAAGRPVRKSVSPLQFARAYRQWRNTHQQLMEEVRSYSRELRRATDRYDSLVLQSQVLEQTVADPQYQDQLSKATLDQNARAKLFDDGRTVEYRSVADGDWIVRSPKTGQPVVLRSAWNAREINQTVQNAQQLITDIDSWLNDPTNPPNNPPLEQTYREIRDQLQSSWLGGVAAQRLMGQTTNLPLAQGWAATVPAALVGSPLTTIPTLTKPVRRAVSIVTGQVQGRDLAYNALGSTAGQLMNQWMRRTDLAADATRSAELNPTHGYDAIRQSLERGANSHNLYAVNPTASQALDQYDQRVINPIFANSQDPGHDRARAGDVTPWRQKITDRDIRAAEVQHGYMQQVRESLKSRMGGVLKFAGLLTETDRYFREAVGYGLKAMRRPSDFGLRFSRLWSEAPTRQARLDLLNDPEIMDGVVNGMIDTRNTTYKLSDAVQQQAIKNHYAAHRQDYHFDTLEEFLEYMGQERARLINAQQGVAYATTPYQQEHVAAELLMRDIDRSVRLFLDEESGAEMDSRTMGVGQAQIKALSGRSSFSQPRGVQVAPNTFYDYTIGSDRARLQFNSAALRYFQKMELDQLGSTITSMEREQQRMAEEYRALRQASPRTPEFVTRLQYAAQQRREIKEGKLLTTLGNLERVLSDMRAIEAGIKRLMDSANTEINQPLRMASRFEVMTSMGRLASLAGRFTDLLSQTYVAPLLINHYLAGGKFRIFQSLMVMTRQTGQLAKNVYRTAIHLAGEKTPMGRLLTSHPGLFLGLANHFIQQLAERRADINYLESLGVQPALPFRQLFGRQMLDWRLAKTSGQITTREGGAGEAAYNLNPFNLAGAMGSLIGTWGNAQVDAFGLRVQLQGLRSIMRRLQALAVQVGRVREQAGIPPGQALLPAEIGEDSQSSLSALRDILSPAGTLEQLFADYYQRRQASPTPEQVPFLQPGQERDVLNRLLSRGNLINDSGRGEALKGKGNDRIWRSAVFRFTSYPLHFAEWIRQSTARDLRDPARSQWGHTAAVIGLLPMLALIALANIGGGQALRELQTGKVPSTPTLTALAGDGSPEALAKAWVLGGSSLFLPLLGDYISASLTGQKGRDITDLTAMIPGAQSLANVGKMVTQTAQSGDLYYPLTGFLKSTSPLFEAAYNRTAGASELDQLNAARAFRSAAPSDLEVRQPQGGATKLTPQTPDVRDALRAAANDDEEGFKKAVDSAIAKVVAAGADPATARQKILRSIQARSPERAVFGRELLPEEMTRVEARMTGGQRQAVARLRDITGRIRRWTGQQARGPRGKSSGRRSGLTARLGPRLPRLRRPSLKAKQLRPKLATAGGGL